MNQVTPVSIVSGFLGSGKTTLLSNLLKELASPRLAVLVNEFGEVSMDGAILKSAAENTFSKVYELSDRLVAYSPDDNFIPTMKMLIESQHSIDQIFIETSGLALPTAAMQALRHPDLQAHFILDAAFVVVDTPRLLNNEFEKDTPGGIVFEQQLESADVVILNKINDLDEKALLLAEKRIRVSAPGVRFIELAFNGRLDPRTAMGLRLNQPTHNRRIHASARSGKADVLLSGHTHSGLEAHEHGINTHEHLHEHDPGWLSFTLRSKHRQSKSSLTEAMQLIANSEPLLRAKGFASVADKDERILLQAVRDRVAITSANQNNSEVRQHFDYEPHGHDHDHDHHGPHSHDHDHDHHGPHSHAHDHEHHGPHSHDHDHEHHGPNSHDHDHEHHGPNSHDHDHEHHGPHSHDHDHEHHDLHSHDHHHEHHDLHSHDHHQIDGITDKHKHPGQTELLQPSAEIVFIGYHLDRQKVTSMMNQTTNTMWE